MIVFSRPFGELELAELERLIAEVVPGGQARGRGRRAKRRREAESGGSDDGSQENGEAEAIGDIHGGRAIALEEVKATLSYRQ